MKIKDIKQRLKDKDLEIAQMKRSLIRSKEKLKSLEFFTSVGKPSIQFLYKLYKMVQKKSVDKYPGLVNVIGITFKHFTLFMEYSTQIRDSKFRTLNKIRKFKFHIYNIYKHTDNETKISALINSQKKR